MAAPAPASAAIFCARVARRENPILRQPAFWSADQSTKSNSMNLAAAKRHKTLRKTNRMLKPAFGQAMFGTPFHFSEWRQKK
jgi:hypothetical protein